MIRRYLRDLWQGVKILPKLMPEAARVAFCPLSWAENMERWLQRYADRQYTARMMPYWEAEYDKAREQARAKREGTADANRSR